MLLGFAGQREGRLNDYLLVLFLLGEDAWQPLPRRGVVWRTPRLRFLGSTGCESKKELAPCANLERFFFGGGSATTSLISRSQLLSKPADFAQSHHESHCSESS